MTPEIRQMIRSYDILVHYISQAHTKNYLRTEHPRRIFYKVRNIKWRNLEHGRIVCPQDPGNQIRGTEKLKYHLAMKLYLTWSENEGEEVRALFYWVTMKSEPRLNNTNQANTNP